LSDGTWKLFAAASSSFEAMGTEAQPDTKRSSATAANGDLNLFITDPPSAVGND
jgi:hypothetical protein